MRNCLCPVMLAAVLALAGCYTVPETGRSSLILPLVDDVAEGTAAFADLKAKGPVSTDPGFNERVRRVGQRIAQAVGGDMPSAQWEFVVFDAPRTVNAFALPGGKVGVYSGLLILTDNDDQLANVLGHEIAHVTARHGAERVTESALAALGGVVLDVSTRNKGSHDALLVGYGLAASGTVLSFSRAHEREADYIGIRYAAKAGYDPRAAVVFWQKMLSEKEKSAGAALNFFFGLLSTHPLTITRIADLQKWMPDVLPLYEAAKPRYK